MKDEQDKWIEGLRNRMKDYSEPAPEQLWEQLSAELERPKVVPFYARWRMVAAVIVLLVVSSLTVWFVYSPSSEYTKEVSKQISQVQDKERVPANREPDRMPAENLPSQPVAPVSQQLAMASPSVAEQHVEEAVMNLLQKEASAEETNREEVKGDEKVEQTPSEKPTEEPNARKNTTRSSARNTRGYGYSFKATSQESHDRSWEIGISLSNVPVSSSSQTPGYTSMPQTQEQNYLMSNTSQDMPSGDEYQYSDGMTLMSNSSEQGVLNQILSNNVQNPVVSDVKHRTPITVGASIRLHLNKRWACETGLTYTFLSSDIRAGGESYYYEIEQHLHYVGIPVKVSYDVWENKRFSFYVSAGGAVEKCVSAENRTVYTTDDQTNMSRKKKLDVDPLQWSLSSAIGAQFKFSDRISIYAEPGVAYYFDDGTDVQTIRKEHPFNFNLQLGVRLSY